MPYIPILFDHLCQNLTLLISLQKPALIGNLFSRRPFRRPLFLTLESTNIFSRLRDFEGTQGNPEVAIFLHRQLIYYPEDFPDSPQEITKFKLFLEQSGYDKQAKRLWAEY